MHLHILKGVEDCLSSATVSQACHATPAMAVRP